MNWQFLRRPRWILGHVIIVVLSIAMLCLSAWQFQRLGEQKKLNAEIRKQIDAPPLDISGGLSAELAPYRRVTFTGAPVTLQSAYVRYPIQDGQSGFYVVTTYRLGDGTSVAVARGWVPVDKAKDDSLNDIPAAPTRVTGLWRASETAKGTVNKTTGRPAVPTVASVDTRALQQLFPGVRLADNYVEVIDAAVAAPIKPIDAPEINEGSHFSYALQWIAFTLIIVLGYGVLLYRVARDQSSDGDDPIYRS